MRHIYFILIFCLSLAVSAQTTVNFTSADGYEDGGLQANADWYAANANGVNYFTVDATAGKVTTSKQTDNSETYKKAVWKESFDLNGEGDYIKFNTRFSFVGDIYDGTNFTTGLTNFPIVKIGFTSNPSGSSGNADETSIIVSWSNWNKTFRLYDADNSTGAQSSSGNWIQPTYLADAGQDFTGLRGKDITLELKLTLGDSKETSKLEGRFKTHGGNSDTGGDKYSGWGIVSGATNITLSNTSQPAIPENLYNAATGTGTIHGFMSTMQFAKTGGGSPVDTGFTAIEWQSVQMQPTLLSISDVSLPEFMLSNNPVGETVEISGIEAGSKINIYTITGAKASNHVYNGRSLNLSHLNTGVYFMETPGFAVKKMLKK